MITGIPDGRVCDAGGDIGVLYAGHGESNHNVSAQRQGVTISQRSQRRSISKKHKEFLFLSSCNEG